MNRSSFDGGLALCLSPIFELTIIVFLLTILLSIPYSFYEFIKGIDLRFNKKYSTKTEINLKRIFFAMLLLPFTIATGLLSNLVIGVISRFWG